MLGWRWRHREPTAWAFQNDLDERAWGTSPLSRVSRVLEARTNDSLSRPGSGHWFWLSRIKFDDQLFVDDWLNLIPRRNANDLPLERVSGEINPTWHGSHLRRLQTLCSQLTCRGSFTDLDHIARFHIERWRRYLPTVYSDVPMSHHLSSCRARRRKADAKDNVVEACFQ